MKPERIAERLDHLKTAHAKLTARLAAEPKHRSAAAYKGRIAEYERDIQVLEMETQIDQLTTGKPGDVNLSPAPAKSGLKGR